MAPALEAQQRLIAASQAGDRKATDALLLSLEKLIGKIVSGFLYQSAGHEIDDLHQEGMIAAAEAIRYYRVETGYLLTTYVADCARRRIWKSLQDGRNRPLDQLPDDMDDSGTEELFVDHRIPSVIQQIDDDDERRSLSSVVGQMRRNMNERIGVVQCRKSPV